MCQQSPPPAEKIDTTHSLHMKNEKTPNDTTTILWRKIQQILLQNADLDDSSARFTSRQQLFWTARDPAKVPCAQRGSQSWFLNRRNIRGGWHIKAMVDHADWRGTYLEEFKRLTFKHARYQGLSLKEGTRHQLDVFITRDGGAVVIIFVSDLARIPMFLFERMTF